MRFTTLYRTDAGIERREGERSAPIFVDTSLGRISLRITDDLPALQTLWEAIQAKAPCTAAQTYDWAKAWARHDLVPEGKEAAIAVGHTANGAPLFLWPFEIGKVMDLAVLKWLSQDHANYNMGLFEPEAAPKLTADDLSRLLREVARKTGTAAALFKSQPFAWDGAVNPFAKLPHQPAPSTGYAITSATSQRSTTADQQTLEENARSQAAQHPRGRSPRLWRG